MFGTAIVWSLDARKQQQQEVYEREGWQEKTFQFKLIIWTSDSILY